MKYWIVVVSKDHIARGVEGGFMQANHGKEAPLKRMDVGDGVIFYSPKITYGGNEPLQAFTAKGEVTDDKIYQHKMANDFIPYRRNINYHNCKETPIVPLISQLSFIENKTSWGYKFRFGFFEIPEGDYELIRDKMIE